MPEVTIQFYAPGNYWPPDKKFAAFIWHELPYLGDESALLVMECDDFQMLKKYAEARRKAVLLKYWRREDDPEVDGHQWVKAKGHWTPCGS